MSALNHSKERACHEIQLHNPRGTWLQLHSCRSLDKHARANLARGRSFWRVGARDGKHLLHARILGRDRSHRAEVTRHGRQSARSRELRYACAATRVARKAGRFALAFEEHPCSRSLPSTRDTTRVERPCDRFLSKARRKASDMKKKHEAQSKTQPPHATLDGIKHG